MWEIATLFEVYGKNRFFYFLNYLFFFGGGETDFKEMEADSKNLQKVLWWKERYDEVA